MSPVLGWEKQVLPFRFCKWQHVCVLVCVHMYVYVCVCVCAYVRVWLCICVLCRLCPLSQNIEFHGLATPGAVGVACGAIPDDNTNANHCYFMHLHIICIQGYYIDDGM